MRGRDAEEAGRRRSRWDRPRPTHEPPGPRPPPRPRLRLPDAAPTKACNGCHQLISEDAGAYVEVYVNERACRRFFCPACAKRNTRRSPYTYLIWGLAVFFAVHVVWLFIAWLKGDFP